MRSTRGSHVPPIPCREARQPSREPAGTGSLVSRSRNQEGITHLAALTKLLAQDGFAGSVLRACDWRASARNARLQYLAPDLAAFAPFSCARDGSDSAASSLAPRYTRSLIPGRRDYTSRLDEEARVIWPFAF